MVYWYIFYILFIYNTDIAVYQHIILIWTDTHSLENRILHSIEPKRLLFDIPSVLAEASIKAIKESLNIYGLLLKISATVSIEYAS